MPLVKPLSTSAQTFEATRRPSKNQTKANIELFESRKLILVFQQFQQSSIHQNANNSVAENLDFGFVLKAYNLQVIYHIAVVIFTLFFGMIFAMFK